MKLITRQTRANGVAYRWDRNYPAAKRDQEKTAISVALHALGANPDPDSVDAVVGNSSWTAVTECNECGTKVPVVVQVGEEPDYESSTTHLCRACLVRALAMIDGG